MGRIALSFVLALLPLALKAADQPLSKDDVRLLLIGGASPEKMITLIGQRGVDFAMTPDLAKKFHDDGATDEVIDALQKAGEKWTASGGARPSTASAASPAGAAAGAPAASNQPPPSASSAPAPSLAPQTASGESVEQKVSKSLEGNTPRNLPLAPDFTLRDLDGYRLNLANYKGKVVLLNFWATWCAPCRKEVPELVALQEKYARLGLQVIGLSLDKTASPVRTFRSTYGMNYPVAICDPATRALYGGIANVPTTLLIGRDQRIYNKMLGAPSNPATLEARVKSLLTENPSAPLVASATPAAVAPAATRIPPSPQPAAGPEGSDGSAGINQRISATLAAADRASAASTGSAEAAPPALSRAAAPAPDLSDPSPERTQQIIQEFAAKEKLFKEARDNYTYHQINKIETIDADGKPDGVYQQEWDILFDDSGKRIEHVTYAPLSSLTRVTMTAEDENALRNIQPFVMTTDDLPEYEVKYLGHVKVDQITAYVFSIRPKEIKKGRQYFQGVVWVDDRDLQIVKTEGKPVGELKRSKGENLFPRFTTYREQIDGKFWFPTFTIADDKLYFSTGPVHIKEIIRYTDYKQFKSKVRIIGVTPTDSAPPPDQK